MPLTVLTETAVGIIPQDIMDAIAAGFTGFMESVQSILIVLIPVAMSGISLVAGAKWAIKWIKSMIAKVG